MEAVSVLKHNTYYYGDGIYYEIVYDFTSHSYDAWMFGRGEENHRMYLLSMPERVDQIQLMRRVKEKVADSIGAWKQACGA